MVKRYTWAEPYRKGTLFPERWSPHTVCVTWRTGAQNTATETTRC
ncbi:unnamed protein product [Medioppia subpectinata]|uniref:Uncharacterized protein n=1 Tax=Medioppia subpectinata TaxID=1979941 RepID=A0A7R9KUL3_9ACAR|nr:unnamed protein product [Medioppia subpectinata]CAG2109004.1 unnamed protein product [Medioppia subpectinata]